MRSSLARRFLDAYVSASLGVTAIVNGAPSACNYLVYLNRSDVDALAGMMGGMIRWFAQRRLKTEATNVLAGLRRRLEGGQPDPANTNRQERE